jgi:tetratricopeptide (TPR) repeat protein
VPSQAELQETALTAIAMGCLEAANAIRQQINPGLSPLPATGERSPARIEKAERKLHEILRQTAPAERMDTLRHHLLANPLDVAAMRLLALLEWRDGEGPGTTPQNLLQRALDLSPTYFAARQNLAELLSARSLHAQALNTAMHILAVAPRDARMREIQAFSLLQLGRFAEAIPVYEALIAEQPANLPLHINRAGALNYAGRGPEAEAALRARLRDAPATGEAFWVLAEMKALTGADIATMLALHTSATLAPNPRAHLCYALGQALEHAGDYAASFAAYEAGAAAYREHLAAIGKSHDANAATEQLSRLKKTLTPALLATAQRPAQPPQATPIFVIGMPRAGSSLLEQILASHSLVEGAGELPLITNIVRDLAEREILTTPNAYPEILARLTQAECAALGDRYLAESSDYRHTNRPYFVDKRPWNWQDAGLIHMILPHAKIIDIRRAPMAAGFALFRQLLPPDAAFACDLTQIGRTYDEYTEMMQHYENVFPGRILHVQYENLVENTEAEIRRVLNHCGLPFEESCLNFWQNTRAVATPSAAQVRRPISRDALTAWQNYEPWLNQLKNALNHN